MTTGLSWKAGGFGAARLCVPLYTYMYIGLCVLLFTYMYIDLNANGSQAEMLTDQ